MLRDKNLKVDTAKFDELMNEQKQKQKQLGKEVVMLQMKVISNN